MSGEEKITITMDGKKIECSPEKTYYEVAKENGIEIPIICHHPELKPVGKCRVCVVEVDDGEKTRINASCKELVKANVKVQTNSERVRKTRTALITKMWKSHSPDCHVCKTTDGCQVAKLAKEYVTEEIEREEKTIELSETNEFFSLIYENCIKCGRCERVTHELQVCNVISLEKGKFDGYPSTIDGESFEKSGCVTCGNCVAFCPTGALVSHNLKNIEADAELQCTTTICTYCGVGCSFDLYSNVRTNLLAYVDSNHDNVVNGMTLCVKGRYGWDFVNHQDRLNIPLIKKDGEFVEASWEEAFDLIESTLKKIREESGPDSLAVLTSAKCTNEENYLMQKFARAGLGTNNVDHCARLCHASTVTGLVRAFGSGAMTNSISDLTNDAEVIFIIGSNTTEAHPIIGIKIKQAVITEKTKLIVADPRKIELADYAEIYLQHKPGSDVALINAMMKVILEENLHDEEFIHSRTEGFDELKENLENTALDVLCKIANINVEDLKNAARLFANAKTASIVYSMGITQHTTGTDNVLSLANLAMITGNIGRPGAGVNPLRGQNNVQGACDLGGLPNVYPGYQRVDDSDAKTKFENTWSCSLDVKPGLTVVEIMDAAHKGDVRGIYVMGENPAMSDPNLNHVREALDKVEFLVVQDIFLTETAKYADVVLPGVSFAEKDGTFTNTERRVQRVRKAIEPKDNRMQDWKIIEEMLHRFGLDTSYETPSDIMDEIATITPIYAGITYDRIDEIGLQWPCTDENHPGTKILHAEEFTRGKGKIHAIKYLEPAELPDKEYPLILTTGRNLYHFHTGEMTRRVESIHKRKPIERSQINVKDAQKLGIKEGDEIFIESRRGKISTVANVTDRIQEGVVFMTFHFKESAANILTIDALDPYAKIPEFKVCAIKVSKK
ncbi:MAG: formate dehydrogenase subunit alpha [Candidatus Heimdallarchaeota archaeon]|nr:formate dehydrogenase subunit alpha [Candidatus Heimdallarchaeota archaeon]MCK4878934.1 formate dehydrogenase subunit alpha [Candidatus Heimdallarchaeota archaeon]